MERAARVAEELTEHYPTCPECRRRESCEWAAAKTKEFAALAEETGRPASGN